MQTNVNLVFTEEQITNATEAFTTIDTNLPGLIALSNEEKAHASKMGADTYDYCAKAVTLMSQFPALTPSWISQADSQSNLETFITLRNMKFLVNNLGERIDDTMAQMGIQIKKSSDDFYDNVKAASKRGSVPGADSVVAELKGFYAKSQAEQSAPVVM